jgi:DNA-binding NarL/FixJ family response regulator
LTTLPLSTYVDGMSEDERASHLTGRVLARPGAVETPSRATEVAAAASSRDPAVGLAAVAALRRLLESLEELQVANARAQGWSWQQVADALAVSRQAVHKKYRRSGFQ